MSNTNKHNMFYFPDYLLARVAKKLDCSMAQIRTMNKDLSAGRTVYFRNHKGAWNVRPESNHRLTVLLVGPGLNK